MSANDFVIKNNMLKEYTGTDSSVVIPDGVTKIGRFAFFDNNTLVSVTIPDGIKSIDESAFDRCRNLSSVEFSGSVKSIGESAFSGCYAIKSLVIPEGVTKIGNYAFSFCKNLKSVTIPDSVKTMGQGAFYSCEKLLSVVLPKDLKTIGDSTFESCGKLKSIVLPCKITEIGKGAFSKCKSLEEINIPDTVTYVGEYAFFGCPKLSDTNIDNIGSHIRTAVSMFNANISEIEKALNKLGYNDAPYPSENDFFSTVVNENSDFAFADKFFDIVLDSMKNNNFGSRIMSDFTPKKTIDMCKAELKSIKEKGNSYYHSGGFANVAMSVCLGVACYCFISKETKMEREFNRDKWESSGDYCSAEKVAYKISDDFNGGKVYYNSYKPFGI